MGHSEENRDLQHNYIANIGDGAFFGFGVGFASYTTVIPLFISTLTSSAALIGLVPAIHNVGWQLPQLLTASKISKMERVKPFVMFMTIHERLPILGLAFVGLLLPHLSVTTALIISFLLLIWQGLGAGFTANAWQIMISKVIPGNIRATFYGFQAAASNLLSSLGAFLSGILLSKIAPPYDFASCFLIASVLYVISWFFLNQTRESKRPIDSQAISPTPIWKNMVKILQTDQSFSNYLVSRFISQFGMMSYAFITVFAVSRLGMTTIQAGIMTSILLITQVVANPLLGRLADKWSRKSVLILGCVCSAMSSLLAITFKEFGLFSVVFILAGVANACYWTIGLTISLEFGTEEQRPVYVGMSNTLVAPATILAPLLGGILADMFGYTIMFIVSAIFAGISVTILAALVRDPASKFPVISSPQSD